MSLLDELEVHLRSDAPCYMEFLYRYDPKKKQVFAFYEGNEDSSFYHSIIKSSIDSSYELEEIVAGCKNNVIKLHHEFDWTIYNKNQIVFFVDRDLSYWLGLPTEYDENVFVTDEYSVENYAINTCGFKAWLVHFEGFARASKREIDKMISEFESVICLFKERMMPRMAQAVVAKRHDETVSLSDYKVSGNAINFFETPDGHVSFSISKDERFCEKWRISMDDQQEIDDQICTFKKNEHHYFVRGKWILSFMAELGEYMRTHPSTFAPSLGDKKKLSPTCAVSPSQCFSAIAPYCAEEIPPRLRNLINKTYMCYCEGK